MPSLSSALCWVSPPRSIARAMAPRWSPSSASAPLTIGAGLMDVRMPGLDGLSAARQIRAAEQKAGTGRLRMVALTANASDQDRLAAQEAGMDGFLTKPVDLGELARAIGPPRTRRPGATGGLPLVSISVSTVL